MPKRSWVVIRGLAAWAFAFAVTSAVTAQAPVLPAPGSSNGPDPILGPIIQKPGLNSLGIPMGPGIPQMGPGVPRTTLGPPPSILFFRIGGPEGMLTKVFPAPMQHRVVHNGTVIGFRPGYIYRMVLSEVPQLRNQEFHVSVEVRGALLLAEAMKVRDYPVGLHFTYEELLKVQRGAMVKKVVVLERPSDATPKASDPKQPIEITADDRFDPLVEARERGQPLAIIHIGPRQFDAEEIAQTSIPGTVLLPDDAGIAPPAIPPTIQWGFCPVFDPIHGPQHPNDFMLLYDGGDSRFPAGVTRQGGVVGLDSSDTVATYVDRTGTPRLAKSNRVAICVPRFIIVRSEKLPLTQVSHVHTGRSTIVTARAGLQARTSLSEELQNTHLDGVGGRVRLSGAETAVGTTIVGRAQGAITKSQLTATRGVDGQCQRPVDETPDLPLLIIKWPDKCGANVGEIVTFYLKYTNQGRNPVSSIVVSDSLTGRFEYVAGSQKSDRQALFTTQANESGSAVLRWEIPGTLFPRESGVISFQVRVR